MSLVHSVVSVSAVGASGLSAASASAAAAASASASSLVKAAAGSASSLTRAAVPDVGSPPQNPSRTVLGLPLLPPLAEATITTTATTTTWPSACSLPREEEEEDDHDEEQKHQIRAQLEQFYASTDQLAQMPEMTLRIDTELELLRRKCFCARNAQWQFVTPEEFEYVPKRNNLWQPFEATPRISIGGAPLMIGRHPKACATADAWHANLNEDALHESTGEFVRERSWPPKEFVTRTNVKPARASRAKRKGVALMAEPLPICSRICAFCGTQETSLWRKKSELDQTVKCNDDAIKSEPAPMPVQPTMLSTTLKAQPQEDLPEEEMVCHMCFFTKRNQLVFAQERVKQIRQRKELTKQRQLLRIKQKREAEEKTRAMAAVSLNPTTVEAVANGLKANAAEELIKQEPIAEDTCSPRSLESHVIKHEDQMPPEDAGDAPQVEDMVKMEKHSHKRSKKDRKKSKKSKSKKHKHQHNRPEQDAEPDGAAVVVKEEMPEEPFVDQPPANMMSPVTNGRTSSSRKARIKIEPSLVESISSPAASTKRNRSRSLSLLSLSANNATSSSSSSSTSATPSVATTTALTPSRDKKQHHSSRKRDAETPPATTSMVPAVPRSKRRRAGSSSTPTSASTLAASTPAPTSTPKSKSRSLVSLRKRGGKMKKHTPREQELRELGQYCPVCNQVYENDDQSTFVCCDSCEMWVHGDCDSMLTPDLVAMLANSSEKYICPLCSGR